MLELVKAESSQSTELQITIIAENVPFFDVGRKKLFLFILPQKGEWETIQTHNFINLLSKYRARGVWVKIATQNTQVAFTIAIKSFRL